MASVPKKPLLYADLFKNDQQHPSFSSSSSSSLNSSSQSFLCDSSSSGFSTPPDPGSLVIEDGGDFIAELTRQMAECMLQEEEEDSNKNYGCVDTELGIQRPPAVTKQGHIGRRRRAKGKKLPPHQKKLLQKADRNYSEAAAGHTGSGMRAVFIGPGSGYGSTGTGVFLPRTGGVNAGLPTAGKKKSGCSMVLMPTRVLQVLDLHFNRLLQDEGWGWRQGGGGHELDNIYNNGAAAAAGGNEEEVDEKVQLQLPQEWTY